MTAFLAQARMELRLQAARPFVWFCLAASFALAFGATIENGFGGRGLSWVNGGDAIATRAMLLSVLGIIIAAGITGDALSRDITLGTQETVLMTGAGRIAFGIGRFGVTLMAILAIGAMLVPGMILGTLVPGIPPERIGPLNLAHYGKALGIYVVPNFLLVSALIYAVASRWRSQTLAFVVALGLISLYATALMLVGQEAYRHDVFAFYALLDPFGTIASAEHALTWTVAQNNEDFRPFTGLLLWNRLIWGGVSALLIALGTLGLPRFLRSERQRRKTPGTERRALRSGPKSLPLYMLLWEYRALLRQPGVLILLGFSAFSLWWSAASTIAYSYSLPTTDLLVHNTGFYFDKVLILLIVWCSGEIMWRERQAGVDELMDATPDSDLWRLVAKTAALLGIALTFWVLSILVNIAYQIAQGFTGIDLWLHVVDTFAFKAPYYLWLALIAIAAQAIVRQRYIAMAIVLVVYLSDTLFDALGLFHPIYRFGDTGFFWFSMMDGYGHFAQGHGYMLAYWTLVSLLLWLLGWASLGRGRIPEGRLSLVQKRLSSGRGALAFGALALASAGLGGSIWYQSTILHRWPLFDMNTAMARFERDLRAEWGDVAQPRIVGIEGQIDLFPAERRVQMTGTLSLENQSDTPVDRLMVLFHPLLRQTDVILDTGATRQSHNGPEHVQIWALDTPMAPGDTLALPFSTGAAPDPGFALHNAHDLIAEVGAVEVIGNGTSFMNLNLMPAIGYSERLEHKPAWLRKRYGLDGAWSPPPTSIAPDVPHDTTHLAWVRSMDVTVTTSADQTPLFPGRLVDTEVTADGRKRARFLSDYPSRGWGEVMSARFATHHAERPGAVPLAMYYHPDHDFNIAGFSGHLLDALSYFQSRYGPPPFPEFRVAETALHNDGFGQRGGLAYVSEILTWKSDQRWTDGDDLRRDAATLVALGWWSDQIMPANLPGAKILWSGLPYWSAALYQHRTRGADASRAHRLGEMLDTYRTRSALEDAELPFDQEMKNSAMIREKGALQIIYLAELAGIDRLEAAFADFLTTWRFAGPPYPGATDLLNHLRRSLPEKVHTPLEDLFVHVTNWRLSVHTAETWQAADGKWHLRAEVEARKFRTTGHGIETEVPLDTLVPLAALSGEGFDPSAAIQTEWTPLPSGRSMVSMVLDQRPDRLGIDPWLYLPDPNPQDNVIAVTRRDTPPPDK